MDTASARPLAVRAIALACIGALLTLTACATTPGASAPTSSAAAYTLGTEDPRPPTGEVIATGTVIDTDGDAQLCLGAVMESYPPQCAGIPITNWSWDGLAPDDESGTTRWGAYGMTGTYDGTSFTPTFPPISLALFDTIARPDPVGDSVGATSDEDLTKVQDTVSGLIDPQQLLGTSQERGYVWVDVVWDDGTLQKAADADFGANVVVIRSALWQPM